MTPFEEFDNYIVNFDFYSNKIKHNKDSETGCKLMQNLQEEDWEKLEKRCCSYNLSQGFTLITELIIRNKYIQIK